MIDQRNRLFQKFGPLVLEAVVLAVVVAINELRVKAGLAPYTPAQVMTVIENHLLALEKYPWMDRDFKQ